MIFLKSTKVGFCDSCGWELPLYIFSLESCFLDKVPIGSILFTANFNISSGQVILPDFTRLLKSIGNNYVAYKGKFGVISSDGSQLIPFDYDEIIYWNDTSYIAKKNNRFYLLDSNNNNITKILENFSKNFL